MKQPVCGLKSKVKASIFKVLPAAWGEAIRVVSGHQHRQKAEALRLRKNQTAIAALLKPSNPVQLELGAGDRRMPGWTAVDWNEPCDLCLDLSQPLPLPDNSVAQIYASHLLEHLTYPQPLASLLKECWRVLRGGGSLKVAVPDARLFLEAYFNPKHFNAAKYCACRPAFHYHSRLDYVNYIAYMAGHHHHMFDDENLPLILAEAGFERVRIRDFDPALDLPERRVESIYAEGFK